MDMFNMMGKLNEFKANLENTKKELDNLEITSKSINGEVTVVVTGNREIRSIEINEQVYQNGSKVGLEDLLAKTINTALKDAEITAQNRMKEASSGIMPDIPGMPGL